MNSLLIYMRRPDRAAAYTTITLTSEDYNNEILDACNSLYKKESAMPSIFCDCPTVFQVFDVLPVPANPIGYKTKLKYRSTLTINFEK